MPGLVTGSCGHRTLHCLVMPNETCLVSIDSGFSLAAAAFCRVCFLQPSLNCPNLAAVKQKPTPEFEVLEGRCAGPQVCPLSHVKAGAVVCIKRLSTAPDMTNRLRELGFCEDQKIRLVARQSNFICQVCNARLAISGKLAESIMVEHSRPLSKA